MKQASFCTEIEIKPHYVVPDTNCFIDYLPQLEQLIYSFSHAQEHTCTLMVPTVGKLNNSNLYKCYNNINYKFNFIIIIIISINRIGGIVQRRLGQGNSL